MSSPDKQGDEVKKLSILSVNRLAFMLKVDVEKLVKVADNASSFYEPFESSSRIRPFQKRAPKKRMIDNPVRDLKTIQKRIYRELLRPICFPDHILGGVRKRSVANNAEHHRGAETLVTIDVRKCFPSVTNKHVYKVWREVLDCSPPVARILTQLTTYRRCLPQGSPASPLLANLFIWSIDKPVREASAAAGVIYSTWIDDLAFSGEHSRDMIQVAAEAVARYGLRISHSKLRIMGTKDAKLLTGTRIGRGRTRSPKDKLARVRSGIHKLRLGLVEEDKQEGFIDGLVGQLRYIDQLCPEDAVRNIEELAKLGTEHWSPGARKFFQRTGK